MPADLQQVIDKALGFEPASLISNVDELVLAMEGCLEGIRRTGPDDSADTIRSEAAAANTAKDSDPRERDNSKASLPFESLGHFKILRRIGRGGMGDVYQAREERLHRDVAIKVLPAELARDESFVQRFYAEARAAASIVHPNIVQIHFIGEDAGHHFFAMQFVEGETLSELLSRHGRLSVEETLGITEQALSGLAAAHHHGLVHRDIKPANILLDRRTNRVLLADFGLVKSIHPTGDRMTATGIIMGTVDYISPEQARGGEVDARSDLYSFGVLLYQMLSGQLPFNANSPTSMIFQHVYEAPHTAPPTLTRIAADRGSSHRQINGQGSEGPLPDR